MSEKFITDSAVFDHEDTRWGAFHSIAEFVRDEHNIKVKVLVLDKGKNVSYQKHAFRSEIWNILSGSGTMVVNGQVMKVKQGETIFVPCGAWHTAKADDDSKLEVLEVQFGEKTEESDITRKYYEWSEIEKEVKHG